MGEAEVITEVVHQEVARFPGARLSVLSGPDAGKSVRLDGEMIVVGSEASCQLMLTDPTVSRRHLEVSGGPDGYRLRDVGSTNGAFVEGVQVLEARLVASARISVGRTELRFEADGEEIEWPLSRADRFGEVLGRSSVMRRVFAVLERASLGSAAVLLEGEAGTGKESLARALHTTGPRGGGPFVVVETGAFAAALLEAELFGRPAPPWAPRTALRPGALEEASGGTLFIDRIDDLPPPLQARLARALEDNAVDRGGSRVRLDVRIIGTSTRDLEAAVRDGRFREDLFFRLGVVRVRVPPLRERPEDVGMLARAFEARYQPARKLTGKTLEMLSRHDWPGNVRELRSTVERLCAVPGVAPRAITAALGVGRVSSREAELEAAVPHELLELPYHDARARVVNTFERAYLREQLRATGGKVARAAARSGLPRQSVHRILRRHGMNPDD